MLHNLHITRTILRASTIVVIITFLICHQLGMYKLFAGLMLAAFALFQFLLVFVECPHCHRHLFNRNHEHGEDNQSEQ